MAVVLRREETVARGQRAVNRPDIELPPVDGRRGKRLRQVGERHDDFALGERRQRPLRKAKSRQSRHRESPPEHLPTCVLCGHLVNSLSSTACATEWLTGPWLHVR